MRKVVLLLACILLCFTSCRQVSSSVVTDESTAPQQTVDAAATGEADSVTEKKPDNAKPLICIDPGHGFGDVGCTSEYIDCYEYEITYSISLKLKDELTSLGADVIMLHDGKSFPAAGEIAAEADRLGIEYKPEEIRDNDIFSAYERAIYTEILNQTKGLDFFVSLHVNTVENADYVSGFNIDYYEGNPYAERLGEFCRTLQSRLDKKCVIFEDDYENAFKVTKYASHPAVLIETGYATNPGDAADLTSEEWQKSFARTLAECIIQFTGAEK